MPSVGDLDDLGNAFVALLLLVGWAPLVLPIAALVVLARGSDGPQAPSPSY